MRADSVHGIGFMIGWRVKEEGRYLTRESRISVRIVDENEVWMDFDWHGGYRWKVYLLNYRRIKNKAMRLLRFYIHPFPADPHVVVLWVCPSYPFSRPLPPDLPKETTHL